MADGTLDVQALRASIGISHADEKRIARELSPAVAWPTLALAVILPSTLATFVYLGLTHTVSPWILTLPLAFVVYAHYTLVHESIHGNVVSSPKSLHWVNTMVGWIGALGMGSGYPALQRTHVLHHSHTNTERDPDIMVKGPFLGLFVKAFKNIPASYIPLFAIRFIAPERYKRLKSILSTREIYLVSAPTLVHLGILIAAVATGHFVDWLALWFIPSRIAGLLLNIFFQWLPHHPFDQSDRYLNTRISLWPGGTLLLLQQNLHLVHHLWPSVPFYNYARLFKRLRPVLKAEGSRIEGLVTGPNAKVFS